MRKNKAKILIVEDEKPISNFISTILNGNDYSVLTAKTGREALSVIFSHFPDVVLLDLGLPDIDGLDIIKSVRKTTNLPIIVISARTYEREKVEALDAGADDYITKPFGSEELLARIRTALRHTNDVMTKNISGAGVLKTGGLEIDFAARLVSVDGAEVHLTQIEYKLMAVLAKYVGRVLTYDFIISNVWNIASDKDNHQLLRVNMANIRRKIEKNPGSPVYVLTEIGVGYRLADIE